MPAAVQTAMLMHSGNTGRVYASLVGATSSGISSGPSITNVDPASGEELAPGATLTFDLTDPNGASDLAEFVVLVKMPSAWEVAYDLGAASFGPAYGGSRTDITDGYRFTVYRREGWRTPLSVICLPRDAAGGTSS